MNTITDHGNNIHDILSYFKSRTKPWNAKISPKLYCWRTSIPESWIKRYGNNGFKHKRDTSATRCSGYNLNNSTEFLHTLQNFKPKREVVSTKSPKRKKPINLTELSKNADLINQNAYIAEKLGCLRSRSQNTTPFKKKCL